jgi:hypothetical protein
VLLLKISNWLYLLILQKNIGFFLPKTSVDCITNSKNIIYFMFIDLLLLNSFNISYELLIGYGFYFTKNILWDHRLGVFTIGYRKSKGVMLLDLFKIGLLVKRMLNYINSLGKYNILGYLVLEQQSSKYLRNLFYFLDKIFKKSFEKSRIFYLATTWFNGYLTNFRKILEPLMFKVKSNTLAEYELFSWQLPINYPRGIIIGDLYAYKLALNEVNLLNIPNMLLLDGSLSYEVGMLSYFLIGSSINFSGRLQYYKWIIASWFSGFFQSIVYLPLVKFVSLTNKKLALGKKVNIYKKSFNYSLKLKLKLKLKKIINL